MNADFEELPMSSPAVKLFCFLMFVAFCGPIQAQKDVCWRVAYDRVPAEWAGYGYVVEAGSRFQAIPAATIELWAVASNWEEAGRKRERGEDVPATLMVTTTSDEHGRFDLAGKLGTNWFLADLKPGSYEIRAVMPGREKAFAFIEKDSSSSPQWLGRGLRVALSHERQGCSRIYAAGLDDTDCGVRSCEGLPVGRLRILYSDGNPLSNKRLFFYGHAKSRSKAPSFVLGTSDDGFVNVPSAAAGRIFDIGIEHGGHMHLHFLPSTGGVSSDVTLVIPTQLNPFQP